MKEKPEKLDTSSLIIIFSLSWFSTILSYYVFGNISVWIPVVPSVLVCVFMSIDYIMGIVAQKLENTKNDKPY